MLPSKSESLSIAKRKPSMTITADDLFVVATWVNITLPSENRSRTVPRCRPFVGTTTRTTGRSPAPGVDFLLPKRTWTCG